MTAGGAGLGMYHFGVIKALWKQRLLPRVISGSSAGSIVRYAHISHVKCHLAIHVLVDVIFHMHIHMHMHMPN
jgi:predicted acylesterase/phospholipase RssA